MRNYYTKEKDTVFRPFIKSPTVIRTFNKLENSPCSKHLKQFPYGNNIGIYESYGGKKNLINK